jgi:excisionase family DNA binding protein
MSRHVHREAGAPTTSWHSEQRDPEYPMTVREAAQFLGVSPQTVYLWVERRQIPHLRVMGRNIRFLKSDLEPFRSRFKQEVENGQTE